MTWREDLQPASFRGAPFEVEGDSGKFGRRGETHEYPQRDKPYTEDLGRATRRFSLTAFLVGDDYMQRRDALLDAIETKGPGTLVHPWYGRLTVNVTDEGATVTHSSEHGGMCQVSMAFVEAGELEFPAAVDSLGAQSLMAADGLDDAAELDFLDDFSIEGMPSFVTDGVLETLLRYIDLASGFLAGFSNLLASPLESLLDFSAEPADLATSVLGLFDRAGSVLRVDVASGGVVGGGGVYGRNRNAVIALTEMASAFGALVVAPTSIAPATAQAQINSSALAALFQRSALIQAAGMTAAMPMPVFDDAVLVRDSVAAALDEASGVAADPVYVALQTLRAKVYADVTARLASSARLLTITPNEVQPALALAYDRYEDAERELEIVERNRLRHPGFVPAVALKVLSV